MLKTILLSALCVSMIGSTSTLNLFQTDYDGDSYAIMPVSFDIPENIPEGWFPLRAVSEYLPITVSWDGSTQEVVVISDAVKQVRPFLAERRFKASRLPESLRIVRGVTYCSPKFLTGMLPGVSFYNNGLYVFHGEAVESKLIESEESTRFKPFVLTSMYRLKLVMPDDYKMIRECLTGGIAYQEDRGDFSLSTIGCVYPNRKHPVCYLFDDSYYGAQLAAYIGHEAHHVYQYRAKIEISESDAFRLEQRILYHLMKANTYGICTK